ncbi:MAG: hypothetical protein ABFQ89_02625 [Chloroflexota bacterium]
MTDGKDRISYRQLAVFFIPLAMSSSMMTLEPLIVSAFLANGNAAELNLAAYTVMFSIALVIEAPVIMLVSAATALVRSRQSFNQLMRFTLALAGVVVAIGFVFALTPLFDLIVLRIMGIPPAAAEVARPALVVMAIWSFPVAWRRFFQGVLIAHDRTPVVTMATICRLLSLSAALFIGSRVAPDRMLLVSAIAMQVAVFAEAAFVTPSGLKVLRSLPSGDSDRLSMKTLVRFYQPLATMMLIRQASRPLLSAGIAAALLPQRSLAAWPVAWSILLLPFGMTMGIEQLAIAKGTNNENKCKVRRFVWTVGLILSVIVALIAFTPLAKPLIIALFDLDPELQPMVILTLRIAMTLPLWQSSQGLLRGNAIRDERTTDVRTAVVVALLVTALVAVVGPKTAAVTGIIIGAVATMLAAVAEVAWLAWRESATKQYCRTMEMASK